jgi:hypothetical protein
LINLQTERLIRTLWSSGRKPSLFVAFRSLSMDYH